MIYVGICKSCYPKTTIVGWATQITAWRGIHHTGHLSGLAILIVDQIPMLRAQVAIEAKLMKLAREGGYADIDGKVNYNLALNDTKIRSTMLGLVQDLNEIIEKTKAYLAHAHRDRISRLCQKHSKNLDLSLHM